jgi:hypothetical protein
MRCRNRKDEPVEGISEGGIGRNKRGKANHGGEKSGWIHGRTAKAVREGRDEKAQECEKGRHKLRLLGEIGRGGECFQKCFGTKLDGVARFGKSLDSIQEELVLVIFPAPGEEFHREFRRRNFLYRIQRYDMIVGNNFQKDIAIESEVIQTSKGL